MGESVLSFILWVPGITLRSSVSVMLVPAESSPCLPLFYFLSSSCRLLFISSRARSEERPGSVAGAASFADFCSNRVTGDKRWRRNFSKSLCRCDVGSVHPGHCHAGGLGHRNCQGCWGTGQLPLEDTVVLRKGLILWISEGARSA